MRGRRGLWSPWLRVAAALTLVAGLPRPGWSQIFPPLNVHVDRGEQVSAAGADQSPTLAFFGQHGLVSWQEGESDGSWIRKWASTADGGVTWRFGGESTVPPYGWDGGRPALCVDGSGTFYRTQKKNDGNYLLRGQFIGDAFAWGGESLMRATPYFDPRDYERLTADPGSTTVYFTYGNYAAHQVLFMRSQDSGTTWSSPVQLNEHLGRGARLGVGLNGEVVAVYIDYQTRQIVGRRSVDYGATFGPTFVVGPFLDNLNTLPPGVRAARRLDPVYPLAWTFQNLPVIAIDRSTGPHRGRMYAAWVEQVQGTVVPTLGTAYDSEPNDDFETATPANIGSAIEGVVPTTDFGDRTGPDYYRFEGVAGMTIALRGITQYEPPPSFIVEGVQLFFCAMPGATPVQIASCGTWDRAPQPDAPMVFTLPYTGPYYLTVGGAGPYTVFYHMDLAEYRVSPSSIARDHRDVVLTWSDDGGQTWSPRRCVSDGPPRYGDLMPELAVDDRGFVHIGWYDFRAEPHCGSRNAIYWRVSGTGGESFQPSQPIGNHASSWAGSSSTDYAGDRWSLVPNGDRIHFAWVDSRDAEIPPPNVGSEIYTASVMVDAVTATEAAVAACDATSEPGGVRLRWRVDAPEQVASFRVQRAEGGGEFASLAIVLPAPTREVAYETLDPDAEPGHAYRYRIDLVLRDGAVRSSIPVSIVLPAAARTLAWRAAQPNPFAGAVTLRLANPRRCAVDVSVHDLRGARVAVLHSGELAAGETALTWDGRRPDGSAAPAGVYLLRATAAGVLATQRVVRVK